MQSLCATSTLLALSRRILGARSEMDQGYYEVHGQQVKVNADRVSECVQALDDLIAFID